MDAEFAEFVASRYTHLCRCAYLLVGDEAAAEDLVQEALVKVLTAYRSGNVQEVEAYTRTAMVNLSVTRWRRRARRSRLAADFRPLSTSLSEPDSSSGMSLHDAMWSILSDLSARQRAVLVLRFYEDMTETQIAETLGITVGTVRTHAARGMERMRELLSGHVEVRGEHP